MVRAKFVGKNWFHRHPILECELGVDERHVIIDKDEYVQIADYLIKHPEIVREICSTNIFEKGANNGNG